MARIIVSENVTLDGVAQDPMGDDGSVRGGWFHRIGDADRQAWAELETADAMGAEALLLGRRSDEWFAARWLSRTGEWADRLNGLPKYVVSSTLRNPRWSNATVLSGDVVDAVSKLKHELDGDIVVYASTQLVRTLLEHDLVDELRLIVHPVVLGAGERLLDGTSEMKRLRLVNAKSVGEDLVFLTYRAVQTAGLVRLSPGYGTARV